KISFRLVPNQDPHAIEQLVRHHIAQITPPALRATLRTHLRSRPALVDPAHPALRAAMAAYRRGFGATPVFLRSGGSIPVVSIFQQLLGIPTALMGFALPDDGMHAPNEKFHLPQFHGGIATCIHFLEEIASIPLNQRSNTGMFERSNVRGAADDRRLPLS